MPENGRQLGRYKILSALGAGGMGEVYLAEDSHLRRKIALKVLPENVASDQDRLRRFEQEAFAASALNHPNILTVHEFGAEDGIHFLASEFVDGETLRERMQGERLSIDEALDVAAQTVSALSAAHEAGIIHRDVKPENIMIRRDRLVKVLDFGLAKLTENKTETIESQAETLAQVNTAPGMIMGTVPYMSPEQARGKQTDARSDIWSIGCVLYEIIGGKTPFAGEAIADRIAAIINQNPVSLSLLNQDVPARLEEIVNKCLEKDREDRYQTTKDLLVDLRQLKKRLEFEVESKRSSGAEIGGGQTGENQPANQQTEDKTQILSPVQTEGEKRRTTSSAEYIATEIKRHKLFAFGVLALLALVSIGGFAVYKYSVSVPVQPAMAGRFTTPQNLNFTRLTSGKISDVRISPDGKYAAYVTANDDSKVSLRMRQIATTSDVEIVAPVEGGIIIGDFTPDVNYLYYNNYLGEESTIYRVPTLGGSPTKIVGKSYTGAFVSPDGKTIAFFGWDKKGSSVILAQPDGSDERIIFKVTHPSDMHHVLAWSPDGKTVALAMLTEDKGEWRLKLYGVNIADGSQRQLSEQNWGYIDSIVWLPDGNLIVSGNEKSEGGQAPEQLWLIAPNAAPQRITNDLNGYQRGSATAKGDVLLAKSEKWIGNLWIAPMGDATRAAQVPSSSEVEWVNWTSDNRFLYTSRTSGSDNIWTINVDGTNQKQLTDKQGRNAYPSMTADGRYIVFMSNRGGDFEHIFRMDADGRNHKQLTNGLREFLAKPSLDGKWIYYVALTSGNIQSNICKMPIDGGESVVIAEVPGYPFIDISPRDGMIAYEHVEEEMSRSKISIITPDGFPVKTLTLPPSANRRFRWTPDGRAIAFIDARNNYANIWAVSLDGKGEAKPLTDFKTESITSFAWSPDGKQFAVTRGTNITDVVLISETK